MKKQYQITIWNKEDGDVYRNMMIDSDAIDPTPEDLGSTIYDMIDTLNQSKKHYE